MTWCEKKLNELDKNTSEMNNHDNAPYQKVRDSHQTLLGRKKQ